MWNEYNCMLVWTYFGIALLWILNENWPFSVLWPLLSFPYLLAYWVQHFIKLWKVFTEMKIPGHLACLLRNLYVSQVATVRTRHGNKRLVQNCERSMMQLYIVILYLYADIIGNSGHDESQAGIKIVRRSINNLRYADDTTLIS